MSTSDAGRARFEYGKHETFPVRHGWLTKGLRRIAETGFYRGDLETADVLGLGSRMAKSLQFWLEATGLSESGFQPKTGQPGSGHKRKEWRITEFGQTVLDRDPYLQFPATWHFLHLMLAKRERSVWGWFFNDYPERYFTREACIQAFRSHAEHHATNEPSLAMAQREIGCLLQAYSVQQRSASEDPENATVCPLRDLRLVVRHADVDRFERTQPIDAVPVEAFLACAGMLAKRIGSDSVTFTDLVRSRFGPRRILGLGIDQVEKAVDQALDAYGDRGVRVTMMGAERQLGLPELSVSEWLKAHFRRIGWSGG